MNPSQLCLLDEATKSLLGYFVYTWFHNYLTFIVQNCRRLFDLGLVKGLAQPTEKGRYSLLFDLDALNLEQICYIQGIYNYIMLSHKAANYRLMNQHERKQVLYLRGYDFNMSAAIGSDMATDIKTMHTFRFTGTLDKQLSDRFQLFKVISPTDVSWETGTAQDYFYGKYREMNRLIRNQMCSFFLNALHWKKDVTHLLDRMDHYIVYVSSITEGIMWELDQLDTDGRRGRVTVVFDEGAVHNKEYQLMWRDQLQDLFGDKMIWSKKGLPPAQNVGELRRQISHRFLVTTPHEFVKDIEEHRRRISRSSAHLAPGERETWLEFRFHPSLGDAQLKDLRDLSAEVQVHIANWIGDRGIDCLPEFLNLVQLRIFITLLMGAHDETGRALAAYAAVMQGARDYFAGPSAKVRALPEEERERLLDALSDHLNMALYTSKWMLCLGKTHQFDDFTAVAKTEFETTFAQTKCSVDHFFANVTARHDGKTRFGSAPTHLSWM